MLCILLALVRGLMGHLWLLQLCRSSVCVSREYDQLLAHLVQSRIQYSYQIGFLGCSASFISC